MNEDDDFVREWAKVKAALREVRREKMKALGYTESALADLHEKALAQMKAGTTEMVATEFGDVQMVKKQPYAHKNSVPMKGVREELWLVNA